MTTRITAAKETKADVDSFKKGHSRLFKNLNWGKAKRTLTKTS